jgi:ABC-type amino acid transport substrate-binding protein
MYQEIYSNNNQNKESVGNNEKGDKLKVVWMNTPPFNYVDKLGNNTGFEYEIFKEFVKDHNVDYELIMFHFPDTEAPSWNQVAQDISDGKYDIAIGQFTQNAERKLYPVLYSKPLFFDVTIFFYDKTKTDVSNNFGWRLAKVIFQFFILVLIMSLILAFIHKVSSNKNPTYLESLWRVSTSLLGANSHLDTYDGIGKEVSKRSKTNFLFLISRTLIIFLSVLLSLYLAAIITSERLANITTDLPFKKESDISGKNILVVAGTSDADTLKKYKSKYNFNIVERELSYSGAAVSKYFEENKEKENLDAIYFAVESMSSWNDTKYGKGELVLKKNVGGWLINPNKPDLLLKFNETYFKLRSKDIFKDLCKKYFKNKEILCVQ